MDGYNFRRSVLQDLPHVTDLSRGIYDGVDHTPFFFCEWLQDPLWHVFIAENENSNVIGFLALHVVDGGHSVVERSARIHTDHRGRGVIKHLLNFALSVVKQNHPNLEVQISSQGIRPVPTGYEVKRQISFVGMRISVDAMKQFMLRDASRPKKLHPSLIPFKYLLENYSQMGHLHKLVPNDLLTIENEVYHISSTANINLLAARPKLLVIHCLDEDESVAGERWAPNDNERGTIQTDHPRRKSDTNPSSIGGISANTSHINDVVNTDKSHVKLVDLSGISNGFALLNLEKKLNNLGYNQFTVDLYGPNVARLEESITAAIKLAWKEADYKCFCISLQCELQLGAEVFKQIEGVKGIEVLYQENMQCLEKQLVKNLENSFQ